MDETEKKCSYKKIVVDGVQVREHRHLMEKKIGRKLRPDEVVHHIDGNKLNNNLDNLVVMTRAEHVLIHDSVSKNLSPHFGHNKGIKMSDETRRKMSESKSGEKHHFYGKHLSKEHRAKLGRAVMCIETGKVYDTLAEAAEDVNIKCKSNIIAVCKNNRKTCGGYHWRYAE